MSKRQNSKARKTATTNRGQQPRRSLRQTNRMGSGLAGSNYSPGGMTVTGASRDTLRTTVRGAVGLVNASAGVVDTFFTLSLNTDNGLVNLSAAISSLAGNYRHFRLRRVVIRIFGTTPLTSGGFIAAGYDPAPIASSPGTLQAVTNHVHSVIVPVGEVGEIQVPFAALPQEFKRVSGLAVDETNCCGILQIYGQNAGANSAPAAMVEVGIDIELKGFS